MQNTVLSVFEWCRSSMMSCLIIIVIDEDFWYVVDLQWSHKLSIMGWWLLFQTVYSGPQLDHPYGLAYFDLSVYWTEFQKGTVHRKSLSTFGDTIDTLSEEFSPLFEIRVFDNSSQKGDAHFFKSRMQHSQKCEHACTSQPVCSSMFLLNFKLFALVFCVCICVMLFSVLDTSIHWSKFNAICHTRCLQSLVPV